jgi:nucleoporin NUP159
VRSFEPQAKIPLPTRISQLAFTADEQYLILSAETGGGLAVYDVQALTSGASAPAFELPTNGEALRAIIPNPMPDLAFAVALVTDKGNLLMANLKERKLSQLATQASCAAWSSKGKQLVAGLADGTVRQMTPDGANKGTIPKPPGTGNYHVSSIMWLENNVWLLIHTPTGNRDKSIYHIVTKSANPPVGFEFRMLTDPVDPFLDDKLPVHHLLRLRDFEPSLQDLVVVSSTAAENLGMLSKSKTPLSDEKSAMLITHVFTTTEPYLDSNRASIPVSEDMADTWPVGLALDLSAKEPVYKPIPTDEIEHSQGPLPAVWALNNEGVLAAWWVAYKESIRAGTTYKHLAAVEGSNPVTSPPTAGSSSPAAFGSPAPPAARPPFGSPASVAPTTPAFGSTSFGAAPAAASPAFGAPSFGSSSFGSKPAPAGPAFGQSSAMGMGMGQRTSPWATGGASASPAFGQSSFGNASATPQNKVFGSNATGTMASSGGGGGFTAFANKGGFGSLGGGNTGGSIFGTPDKSAGSFGSGPPEVSMDTGSAFLAPATKPPASGLLGSSPFVLGTTFKADPKTANENEVPKSGGSGGMFGSSFGLSLGGAGAETNDADMDVQTPANERASMFGASTTPTTTPAANKFGAPATAGPTTGSLGLFGRPSNAGKFSIFGSPSPSPPKAKNEEAENDKENVPEAPLPPDTTSKAPYPLGESSSSSVASRASPAVSKTPLADGMLATSKESGKTVAPSSVDDAPLPPMPSAQARKKLAEAADDPTKYTDDAPLPPMPSAQARKKLAEAADDPTKFAANDVNSPILPSVEVPGAEPPEPPPLDDSGEDEGNLDEDEVEEGEDNEVPGDDEETAEEGQEEDDVNSEGSGIDVAKDLSPTTTTGFASQTPGFTPQSSFGGMGGSTFSAFERQGQEAQQQQRTLFGEINRHAPVLPRPQPTSPRSPSPVRSAVPANLLRADGSRSVSAPGMASQLLGASSRKPALTSGPPQTSFMRPAQPAAPVPTLFEDLEDNERRQQLAQQIEGTVFIDGFVAVESQLPELKSDDVVGASESLFRDNNRMLGSLGLNARSLKAFIKGHSEPQRENGRSLDDLENSDDWVLCEVEDCGQMLTGVLKTELEDGRIQDMDGVSQEIATLAKDAAKQRARQEDLKRIIAAHLDPSQVAQTKSMPLSSEQASQQNELRRAYAAFSSQLGKAEEEIVVAKAKLASASRSSGRKGSAPTVDAVVKTISKMTSMAEKRSGDVDVLETQMRKLGIGPGSSNNGTGSPASTPQRRSLLLSQNGDSGSSNMRSSILSLGGSSVMGRAGSATPTRKKVAQYTEEERSRYAGKRDQRRAKLDQFRAAAQKHGPIISRLEDD